MSNLTSKSQISTILNTAKGIDNNADLLVETKTVEGVEFKFAKANGASVESAVQAALVGNAVGVVLTAFIRHASYDQVQEWLTNVKEQAKLVYADTKREQLVVHDILTKFMDIVKNERPKLGKDKTFLPFENEKGCLIKTKGENTLSLKPWVDNSWVNKAIYAAKSAPKTEEQGGDAKGDDNKGDDNKGDDNKEATMLDRAIAIATLLDVADLESLQSQIASMIASKKQAKA